MLRGQPVAVAFNVLPGADLCLLSSVGFACVTSSNSPMLSLGHIFVCFHCVIRGRPAFCHTNVVVFRSPAWKEPQKQEKKVPTAAVVAPP